MNPAKTVVIYRREEADAYRREIEGNLCKSVEMLRTLMDSVDAPTFFKHVKYEKTVVDPLTGAPENLIEAINQCQTYLVSVMAVEYLLEKHPGLGFRLNMGNVSGYDVESEDGCVIAECFAAASYRSNGKLSKDLKRLAEAESAVHKYEFFYDLVFTDAQNGYYKEKYPGIEIVKFTELV